MITLAWPDSKLSPNARVHWATKAKAAKAYRMAAFVATLQAKPALLPTQTPQVVIRFHAPDKRRRDLDNMLSSIKSGLDGIAEAIGVDDSEWSITISKGAPFKFGCVIVEVTA